MCIICIEYEKQKLTTKEAIKNLQEIRSDIEEEHYWETYNKLNEDLDDLMSEEWWEKFGFGD
jgi:hypothetical protein